MEGKLCDYGCGQEGKFQMKNEKWCCSSTINQCAEMRRKNSEGSKRSLIKQKNLLGWLKSGKSWNRGKTKETDSRIKMSAEKLRERFVCGEITPGFLGKHHTDKTKLRLSESGGKREGSGRGKKGWYKGYYCDSTWELAFVVYNIEHDIKFSRNNVGFEYEFGGKKHRFYPDFKMEDGSYVEIKGWMDEQNKAKIKQFDGGALLVLSRREIRPYLEYVVSMYGGEYARLYDEYADDRIVCSCGKWKSKKSLKCKVCADIDRGIKSRRVERPTRERLEELVSNTAMTRIGKMFGVSDNSIRKWCKDYGI